MSMMDVGKMRVLVHYRLVPMPVLVGHVVVPWEGMFVLVVCVVDMAVTVLHRLMYVFVLVVFSEVQPDAASHQRGRNPEGHRGRFA